MDAIIEMSGLERLSAMDWTAVFIALGIGLAGLATTFFSGSKGILQAYLDKLKRRANREEYVDGILRVANFHAVLEQLKKAPFVDRVLVFVGRNGGGIPEAGKPYTVSCFYGWSQDPAKHPELAYNFKLKVDSHYLAMLADCLKDGKSIQTTAMMNNDSQLKKYYLEEGVVMAVLHSLRLSDNDFMYLSTGTYNTPFTPGQMSQIDLIVERLRSVMDPNAD